MNNYSSSSRERFLEGGDVCSLFPHSNLDPGLLSGDVANLGECPPGLKSEGVTIAVPKTKGKGFWEKTWAFSASTCRSSLLLVPTNVLHVPSPVHLSGRFALPQGLLDISQREVLPE